MKIERIIQSLIMRQTLSDVHQQFAEFFPGDVLKPYAYLVSKRLSEGHICLNLDEVDETEMPVSYKGLTAGKAQSLAREKLVAGHEGGQPFILHDGRLYLQRYFSYETSILEDISRLVKAGGDQRKARCAALVSNAGFIKTLFQDNADSGETDWQFAGAILGAVNDFTIITGGPGTGKTTTLARLLAVLYTLNPDLKVALAAPTGKAAMRMAESLQTAKISAPERIASLIKALVPKTVHRLLRSKRDSRYFYHNRENPLFQDVVVIDEASMVDVGLFARLLEAIRPGTRLILLGDRNQLASVDAGTIFGDLCQADNIINSSPEPVAALLAPIIALPVAGVQHLLNGHIIELKKSHRFTASSEIGQLARTILAGDPVGVKAGSAVIIDTDYSPAVLNSFFAGFEDYISEPDIAIAIQKFNRQRILCAVWEGDQGVTNLNRLAEILLKRKKALQPDQDFYENRPVMITKNYPDLKLFNGDIGIIREDAAGKPKAWFPDGSGGIRDINTNYIFEVQTVFAMTIHKSQGSEYENILIVLPEAGGAKLLTRELLYTAVTRARSTVTIQASRETIDLAVSTTVKRASGIADRLAGFQQQS